MSSKHASTHITPSYLSDVARIVAVYCAWKSLLLIVVLARPGPDYDTSTQLLFNQHGTRPDSGSRRWLYDLALALTRWDGLYFSSASTRGYVYEQQWAFSWAYTRFTALLADVLLSAHSLPSVVEHALLQSAIAFISHLGSVVLLYFFTIAILPSPVQRAKQIARTTAYLHTLSPAGIFLLAPYAEATFSLLSLAGMLSYAYAIRNKPHSNVKHAMYTLLAGALFGLATTIRNNGLLSGIIFAWDALSPSWDLVFGPRTPKTLRQLSITVLAGTFVAIGFALPQYVAYQEYCTTDLERPWCNNMPPSIYSWVQEHYWEVGFLKYWTLSNIPLFALAVPVLWLMLNTGYAALHHARSLLMAVNGEERPSLYSQASYQADRAAYKHILERLAVPQIVLALLAVTSFHVQIINRISSGYPIWYLVLAIAVDDQSPTLECGHSRSQHYYPFRQLRGQLPKRIVQGFVMYAVVQAGLYASFLPPA